MFVLVAVAIFILTFLMLKIVPVFVHMMEEFELELPRMTELLIAMSNFVVSYWFLIPLLPVGVWLVTQLPASQQQSLLGSDPLTTLLLGLSVMTALWLMHLLAAAAFGETDRKTSGRSVAVMLLIVTLMTAVSVRMD